MRIVWRYSVGRPIFWKQGANDITPAVRYDENILDRAGKDRQAPLLDCITQAGRALRALDKPVGRILSRTRKYEKLTQHQTQKIG
ncbi:MAG: hypothetical protein PSY12_10260 [bacterium]|nr:hypothetical protein [bacterium]